MLSEDKLSRVAPPCAHRGADVELGPRPAGPPALAEAQATAKLHSTDQSVAFELNIDCIGFDEHVL